MLVEKNRELVLSLFSKAVTTSLVKVGGTIAAPEFSLVPK
jgi:hypothetical protein